MATIKLYLNSDCCDHLFNVFIGFYQLSYKKSLHLETAQSAFACSKLSIETVEQGVKYVQN